MADKIVGKGTLNKDKAEVRGKVLEGAEELLVEWGHALNELAFSSREGFNTFQDIEETAAIHWLKSTIGELTKTKTAYEAAVKYRDLADGRKVIKKENFQLEEKGEVVQGIFLSEDCPYKKSCLERKKTGKQFICFRATPFIVAIKLMAGKEYKSEVLYEQTEPGRSCLVQGLPTEISFKVGLSYKLSKGTVKLHEMDAKRLGLGLIDTIIVRPSRKEIESHKLTAMSYTQTKYPQGMILMNIVDAKTLGLAEKDTVFISKGEEKEEASLVDVGDYEAKAGKYEGQYETPDLEIEEETKTSAESMEESFPEEVPEKGAVKEKKSKKKERAIAEEEAGAEEATDKEASAEDATDKEASAEDATDKEAVPEEAEEEPAEALAEESEEKNNIWQCEFCDRSFNNKREAIKHEENCKNRKSAAEEVETETSGEEVPEEEPAEEATEAEDSPEEPPKKKEEKKEAGSQTGKKNAFRAPSDTEKNKKEKTADKTKAMKNFEEQIEALRKS